MSHEDLAEREGLEEKAIREGIDRARESELEALAGDDRPYEDPATLPLFPCGPFTPQSTCPHTGPLPSGRPRRVCMVCHRLSAAGR